MKLSCDVIRDLLLLYDNQECSEETRKLVEEHLAECPECGKYHKCSCEISEVAEENTEELEETKVVKKGLRKMKKRWLLSLIAALLIVPLSGIGKMAYNESKGCGICFTNLDDIHIAKTFMKHIRQGELEEAADMIDYTESYWSLIKSYGNRYQEKIIAIYGKNPTEEEFTKIRREQYLTYLEEFWQKGYRIEDIRYTHEAQWYEHDREWEIHITFKEISIEGTELKDTIAFRVNEEGKLEPSGGIGTTFSALQYALFFNNMWHLDETPTYEEYLERENSETIVMPKEIQY